MWWRRHRTSRERITAPVPSEDSFQQKPQSSAIGTRHSWCPALAGPHFRPATIRARQISYSPVGRFLMKAQRRLTAINCAPLLEAILRAVERNVQLLEWWSSAYSNHAALRTGIEFTHIAGLVAGGGSAITADLATIIAARARSATLAAHLHLLRRTHPIVIGGLVALFASGLLLFAADVDTFWNSRIFWVKMALVLVLIVNGVLLVINERRVMHVEADATAGAWGRLHLVATTSLVLWLLTTLAGSA